MLFNHGWIHPFFFLGLCRLFDLSWVRPLCGHESWLLSGSFHFVDLCKIFYPCWVRPLCGHEFWSPVGSVHFLDLCKFLTLVGSVHFVDKNLYPPWSPSTLWTHVSFLTLVGSVHFVDKNLDPLQGSSTLCSYVNFLPLLGPSTLWTWIWSPVGFVHLVDLCKFFYPCWVRPLFGQESWPPWGPSTLWTYVSFDPCWVRLLCGQESWSPARSVHLVGLRKFFTLVGSVHFVDMNLIPRGIRPPCGLM